MSKNKILVCPEGVTVDGDTLIIPSEWENIWDGWEVDPSKYFTIRGSTPITLHNKGYMKTWNGTLEYFDFKRGAWREWNGEEISSGDAYSLLLRGSNNTNFSVGFNTDAQRRANIPWVIGGEDIDCTGSNIEYLLDYRTVDSGGIPTAAERAYAHLFSGSNIVFPPVIPRITKARMCLEMFSDCTKLKIPPVIRFERFQFGTSTAECCGLMFYGCTALEKLPTFVNGYSGTNFTGLCFQWMFRGCTKIKMSTTQDETYVNAFKWMLPGDQYYTREMFAATGGTFTGSPVYQATYYTSNEIIADVIE